MKKVKWIAALGVLLLFLVATATPSNAQNSTRFSQASGMSKTQLTALTTALAKALSLMWSKASTKTTSNAGSITKLSQMKVTITISGDSTYPCSKGGYIHSILTMRSEAKDPASGNMSTNGSGTQSIVNWRCVTGWIVNGDPYVSLLITQSSFAGTANARLNYGAGWKAIGPNKLKQSCRISSEIAWSSIGNSGFNNVHVKCMPGGSTDLTLHF